MILFYYRRVICWGRAIAKDLTLPDEPEAADDLLENGNVIMADVTATVGHMNWFGPTSNGPGTGKLDLAFDWQPGNKEMSLF